MVSFESDRGANFFALLPRILINAGDLDATGLIQPGSRITYLLQIAGAAARLLGIPFERLESVYRRLGFLRNLEAAREAAEKVNIDPMRSANARMMVGVERRTRPTAFSAASPVMGSCMVCGTRVVTRPLPLHPDHVHQPSYRPDRFPDAGRRPVAGL